MNKWLYCGWGVMYIASVALSFIPEVTDIAKISLLIFSILFFVPGFLLLYNAFRDNDRKAVLRIRWISLLSLILTTASLAALILTIGSETVFNIVYYVLMVFSAPMLCSHFWAVSLFLWACLLSSTFLKKLPK